jgi:hypothetical protein
MSELKIIAAMYDQKLFNEAVEFAFEKCREEPSVEFLNITLGILRSARDENFLDEALRSLKYLSDFIQSHHLEEIFASIENIVRNSNYSISIRTKCVIELGNLKTDDDKLLVSIIESVEEKDIQIFAFRSALKLHKISRFQIDEIFEKLNSDVLEPNLVNFNTVLSEYRR